MLCVYSSPSALLDRGVSSEELFPSSVDGVANLRLSIASICEGVISAAEGTLGCAGWSILIGGISGGLQLSSWVEESTNAVKRLNRPVS